MKNTLEGLYCNSLTQYQRLLTREVKIGDLLLGNNHPIRVQSMTTTDTMDTIGTVEQSIRMIEAGCELVRITAPSINEAKNLENIKAELRKRGYSTPLVADIHFTPNAAEVAARIVEKVRINPGNFADKKKFEEIEYSDLEYNAELERIRERFIPLVKICKEYGTAMRIGTNHGSLSDRIMSRYGDTAHGMVESALEFLRICEAENFHQIVLSMKSSNPQVMVQAYRLLIARMNAEGMNYPLHLGVTEAGEGEDGRIKSAEGIGTLLEDGIGDTIRVSLTEDPEFEIPVAKALVNRYIHRNSHETIIPLNNKITMDLTNRNELPKIAGIPYSPFQYTRRESTGVKNIGGEKVPIVIADYSVHEKITAASLFGVGYNYQVSLDKWNITDLACDYIYAGDKLLDFDIPGTLGVIYNYATWKGLANKQNSFPLMNADSNLEDNEWHDSLNFVRCDATQVQTLDFANIPAKTVLMLYSNNSHAMPALRRAFVALFDKQIKLPVIIERDYTTNNENYQLYAAADAGGLLLDGMGDGLFLCANGTASPQMINNLSFGILQAARTRISKTEYISCPSCGRTLFDLQETTAKIRSRTSHLKGIKIGIMGCIVNGPGEMADADYGYVGSGVGKITLYKGREVITKNIQSEGAVDALINLIKEHGDWVEPVVE
ncbi:MAG: (E)-4-hydroxy-3-methylbut-2-enyl-diphosphate synthase [Bacteroidota bacterium]